jgi:hypothetical protein
LNGGLKGGSSGGLNGGLKGGSSGGLNGGLKGGSSGGLCGGSNGALNGGLRIGAVEIVCEFPLAQVLGGILTHDGTGAGGYPDNGGDGRSFRAGNAAIADERAVLADSGRSVCDRDVSWTMVEVARPTGFARDSGQEQRGAGKKEEGTFHG